MEANISPFTSHFVEATSNNSTWAVPLQPSGLERYKGLLAVSKQIADEYENIAGDLGLKDGFSKFPLPFTTGQLRQK